MMTCQQYIDTFTPSHDNDIWVHGLDLLSHCLKGDTNQTLYKARNPDSQQLDELRDILEQRANFSSFAEYLDNYKPAYRKRTIKSTTDGELDINLLLAAEEQDRQPEIFTQRVKRPNRQAAVTCLLDMAVTDAERGSDEMEQRHKAIYSIVAQCDSAGTPCRVIGVLRLYSKMLSKYFSFQVVIKDFTDPIFPAIWGALKDNASCNTFLNVVSDYFLGIPDPGNGTPKEYNATRRFADDEINIIRAKRIS